MTQPKRAATRDQAAGETPLCIRFRPGDLDRVRQAAARDKILRSREMTRSEWIREIAMERAEQVLQGLQLEPLHYETAGGVGDQVCIRFRPRDFERIKRAAVKEKALPSPWIRAVVMQRVGEMRNKKNGEHPERRKSEQRVRVKPSESPKERLKRTLSTLRKTAESK